MFKTKAATTAELFAVKESIAGERWALVAGQVLSVTGGARGPMFNTLLKRGIIAAVDRPRAGAEPKPFDPAALDLAPRKAVVRSAPVTHPEVLARFGWDQAALDRATALIGFPKPAGQTFTSRGPRPVWTERQLTEWSDAVKAFAGGLR